jgi:hypothetical protein
MVDGVPVLIPPDRPDTTHSAGTGEEEVQAPSQLQSPPAPSTAVAVPVVVAEAPPARTKAGKKSSSSSGGTKRAAWDCSRCTLINRAGADRCSACGAKVL